MNRQHLITLVWIVAAIALTSCKAKSSSGNSGIDHTGSAVEINRSKLQPVAADQIQSAKDFLKILVSIAPYEETELSKSLPGLKTQCEFSKDRNVTNLPGDLPNEKIRVGDQATYTIEYKAPNSNCPLNARRSLQVISTYWSVGPGNQSTLRSRGELISMTEIKETNLQESTGLNRSETKLRMVEDLQNGDLSKSHLRGFGTTNLALKSKDKIELKIRTEQITTGVRTSAVIKLKTKSATNVSFNYSLQVDQTDSGTRVVKAYVGNVELSEGEIREMNLSVLASKYILSLQ